MFYTTRTEAIEFEIIQAIEAGDATADEFDIDAIADKTIEFDTERQRYYCAVEVEEFWTIVENHAL